MKKLIAVILLMASIFSLASCGDETYDPVESSDVEKTVVMTLKIEEETYNVRYELYRAFFLAYKSEIDGGNASVWTGDNKNEYIAKIDELILHYITEIYSVIHTAGKIGIDIYSDEYDENVSAAIKDIVDGDSLYGGFDGDYSAYLAHLKSINLNYSVQDLMIRYDIAISDINRHYAGYVKDTDTGEKEPGALEYTKDDVSAFYWSEDSVSILRAFFNADYMDFDAITRAKNAIYQAHGDHERVLNKIIGVSSTSPDDVFQIVGKYNLDRLFYSEYTEAAFALPSGETSDIIKVSTASSTYYYVLYRTRKGTDLFNENYDAIAEAYVENEIGRILYTGADALKNSVVYSDALQNLDRSQISMN